MSEWVSGNIFIRPNRMNTGEIVEGHTHNFDHTTIVFRGAFRLEATRPDGTKIDRILRAASSVLVNADVCHKFTALEDNSEFWCVYAHRDPQSGEVVQEQNGFYGAYQ